VVSGVLVSLLFWFKRSLLAADILFYGVFAIVASLMVQTLGVFLVFVLLIGPALLFERFSALLSSAALSLAVGGGLGLSWYLDLPSGICLSLTISAVSLLALRPNPGASVKL
jgi:ABC-type Mn2+/Zn2+ transport system permease subunit